MFRLFYWILIIPLGAAVVAFTVSNRSSVLVNFWPAPFSVETPVFVTVLVSITVGFLLGSVVSFISSSRRRLINRQLLLELENAKQKESVLREQVKKLEIGAND